MRYGDKCVAIDPFDKTPPNIAIDPPLHTRAVGIVRLTADEPATIYYTIDGSAPTLESASEPDRVVIPDVPDNAQLRYFAVDLAGNVSAEGSRVWIIDREGPGAPLDFDVTVAGSSRTVTWTAPPDPRPGGVIVARVEGVIQAPIPGDAYAVGDILAPGVQIVATSKSTETGTRSFSETVASKPGIVRYVAWAYDDLYNYGPPAGDYVLTPVPAQTGTITISAAGGTVAQTVAPSFMTLGGTASLVGSILTAKITLKNDTSRVLFAPKVVVKSGAGTWSNSDGTLATFPYRAYGGAILPGGINSAVWTFTGAGPTTTITLDVEIQDGFVATATTDDRLTAGRIVDFTTTKQVALLEAGPAGQNGGSQTNRGGITPDGRVILGARSAPTVSSFDLSTGKRLLGITLLPQKAHVPQVILDRSGSAAYALVADGHPQRVNNTGGSKTTLVRLDASSLVESGRLELDISRNRDISISPDGKTLLVATGVTTKGVIVVDLTTFTIKTRILPGFRTQVAMYTQNGTSIVVVGEQIAVYNASDFSRTALHVTPGTNGKVLRAAFASADVLWIGRRQETATIDLRTGATQVFTPALPARMLEFFDGKMYLGSGNVMNRVNLDGTVDTQLTGFTNLDGHWVGRSPF